MSYAATLLPDSTFHAFAIVSVVLLIAAAVFAVVERSIVLALLCGGLAALALGFVVIS
jgi:hypothetical protein